MLKMIVDGQLPVIALGIFTALGMISKVVVNTALSRMVRAAGSMSKSNHPLMRLVRAKFEHACMVSEKVENVEVFVDKYLYEYRIFGVRLHSIRRMENASAILCIATGLIGSILTYSEYGMNERVLRIGAIGAGLGILVYVFHLTTDENYRLQMARNYMVDYLQNVCLRRYEKAYQKDQQAKTAVLNQAAVSDRTATFDQAAVSDRTAAFNQAAEIDEDEFEEEEFGEEFDSEQIANAGKEIYEAAKEKPALRSELRPELKSELKPESKPGLQPERKAPQELPLIEPAHEPAEYPIPDASSTIRGAQMNYAKKAEAAKEDVKRKDEAKDEAKEVRIRQILEEFMA